MFRSYRQWFFPLLSLILIGLASRGDGWWASSQAAPLHQTVPIPTATPLNTPVPTATPDSEGDGEEEPTATYTPTPDETQQEPSDESEDTPADVDEEDTDGNSDDTPPATDENSSGEEPADVQYETAKVAPIVLNVRSGPGTENAVIGTVFQDDAVNILGRTGTWWRVCCPIGSTEPGWVDSQFLDPNFDIDALDSLVPEISTTTTTTSSGQSASGGAGVSKAALNDSQLEFQISHDPAFVWQGQQLQMTFVVTNTSSSTANNIRIRNDFPVELTFVEIIDPDEDNNSEVVGTEIAVSESASGATVLAATWPALEGGKSLNLAVVLEVADDVNVGAVVDNLAVVSAANAESVTAGISIGMPPSRLPNFR